MYALENNALDNCNETLIINKIDIGVLKHKMSDICFLGFISHQLDT